MLARLHVPVGWGELLKRTGQEAIADHILDLGAQQAYYFFFALFPTLLALISLASFFPVANLTDQVVEVLGRVAPGDVVNIITDQLAKISNDKAGGLLTLGFVLALWSSSGAMVSMVTTLNAAYGITDSRPWWKVRMIAIALTVGLALFVLLSMALMIAGPGFAEAVAQRVDLGPAFIWTWNILRWPVVFVFIATAIALIYYYAPDAEQDFVWITPGSVLATILWVAASWALKTYFATMGSYTATYGVVGAVMVLLLWFYLTGLALLIGAELNAEIEHASPYGKDVGEKVPGEKKRIGPSAARYYEEKRAKGETPIPILPEGVNCDIDRRPAAEDPLRVSDLLIGTAAILPVALKIGRELKNHLSHERRRDRAA